MKIKNKKRTESLVVTKQVTNNIDERSISQGHEKQQKLRNVYKKKSTTD